MAFGFSLSQKRTSRQEPVAPTAAPTNVTPPSITGTLRSGQTVASSFGTWTQSPSAYSWEWSADGDVIAGETARTLRLTDAMIGKDITVEVTATNSFGSASATSSAVGPILIRAETSPPSTTIAPVVTGDLMVGKVLMSSTGTWTRNPTSYGYQWFRNGTALSGATANVLNLIEADLNSMIACDVTATNSAGSATVRTQAVGPIAAALPSMAINIVAEGDSLTDGLGATDRATTSYPGRLTTYLPTNHTYTVVNLGSSGILADQIDTNYATRAGLEVDEDADLNVFVFTAGTNDKFNNRTDKQAYQSVRSVMKKAKASGYDRRLVGTIVSTDAGDAPRYEWNANEINLNKWIKAYARHDLEAHALADFGNSALFDTAAATVNTTYWQEDRIHLTDAGYDVMALIAGNAMTPIIDTLPSQPAPDDRWFEPDMSDYLQATENGRLLSWNQEGFSASNARGMPGKSAGKWYFETEIVNAFTVIVGLMNIDFAPYIIADWTGADNWDSAIGYSVGDGQVRYENTNVQTMPVVTNGQVVCHAIDLDARRYWVRVGNGDWNNTAGANPTTNTGGIDISALGTGMIYPVATIGAQGGQVRSRFKQSNQTFSRPTGFSSIA